MIPLPPACSGCRQPFDGSDPRRRLVVLEDRHALCSECEWRAIHPEGRAARRRDRRLARVSIAVARVR